MARASYLFNGLGDKADRLTYISCSTDAEIEERISASTSSYTMESVEDTFRPGTVFESFHHQAKTPISNSPASWLFNAMVEAVCRADTYLQDHSD